MTTPTARERILRDFYLDRFHQRLENERRLANELREITEGKQIVITGWKKFRQRNLFN